MIKKGMELTLGMNSCMNFHTSAWLLVVPKARVLIKLYPNLGFLKIGLVKPHMVQDNYRILSFRLDSWLIESH